MKAIISLHLEYNSLRRSNQIYLPCSVEEDTILFFLQYKTTIPMSARIVKPPRIAINTIAIFKELLVSSSSFFSEMISPMIVKNFAVTVADVDVVDVVVESVGFVDVFVVVVVEFSAIAVIDVVVDSVGFVVVLVVVAFVLVVVNGVFVVVVVDGFVDVVVAVIFIVVFGVITTVVVVVAVVVVVKSVFRFWKRIPVKSGSQLHCDFLS